MGPQFELILQFMANLVVNTLTEADIPGASLGNRDPEALKVAELIFYLHCRGATGLSKLKTKADYVR